MTTCYRNGDSLRTTPFIKVLRKKRAVCEKAIFGTQKMLVGEMGKFFQRILSGFCRGLKLALNMQCLIVAISGESDFGKLLIISDH